MIYIPSARIKGTFNITSEGLLYVGLGRRHLFEWDKITNIFPWRQFNVLVVIDDDQIIEGRILGDTKYGNSWRKMDYILEAWEDIIKKYNEEVYFEYPEWCREKDSQLYIQNIFWGFGGGLIVLAIVILAIREDSCWPLDFIRDWPIAIGILMMVYGFAMGVKNLLARRRKKISEVAIGDSNLEIIYENGTLKKFDLKQTKKHNLTKRRYKGTIIFKDNSKLEYLERVSYWPILREYLLSKLEPSGKSGD